MLDMSSPTSENMTLAEVCTRLHISRSCAFKMLHQGKFPNAFRVNSRDWRVPSSDVAAFIEKNRIRPKAAASVS